MTTPLQREYQFQIAKEKEKRQKEYLNRLKSFVEDAIKTIREIAASTDPEASKALTEALELDWSELKELKKSL